MEEAIEEDMVKTIQTLTKENDELKAKSLEIEELKSKLAEFEKLEAERKEAELKKEKEDLIKQLVEKTGKDASTFEEKANEVLKELLVLIPDKVEEEVKPKSKGVVEQKEEQPVVKEAEKEFIVLDEETNELTLSEAGWDDFNNKLRDLSWIEKEVRWMPNKRS